MLSTHKTFLLNRLINCGKNSPFKDKAEAYHIEPQCQGIGSVAESNYFVNACMFFFGKKLTALKWKTIASVSLLLILITILTTSCQDNSEKDLSSPPEYDLNKPTVIKLPGYLDEISGLAFYPKDKSVFAISDEKGWLYKIFLTGNMTIQKWKFAKKNDFEDVVLVDSVFYILKSTGELISLQFSSSDSIVVKTYKLPSTAKNEFEILYYEKDQKRLILLCKKCADDDNNSLTAWAFNLTTLTFSPTPAYVIDIRKIETLMAEKKVRFKPSAAAINPVTGRLYIISAINKVLVVADKTGNPQNVYKVNPKLYKQPEGMSFTPEGHLLISNESKDIGAANIFTFKYNKVK